jgi:hypothetical protein
MFKRASISVASAVAVNSHRGLGGTAPDGAIKVQHTSSTALDAAVVVAAATAIPSHKVAGGRE